MSTSDADHRAVADFVYREARLADEARYAVERIVRAYAGDAAQGLGRK